MLILTAAQRYDLQLEEAVYDPAHMIMSCSCTHVEHS